MTEKAEIPLPNRWPWIISPTGDLLWLAATPLAILPLVSLAIHYWITPEQLSLLVISFASVGHHVPGFLRAYGERELFHRFRWRFLLAPPLIFSVAWAFSVGRLHGLELVLLLWATWHVLMQTYGFLRIYDMKRGVHQPLAARLDLAACLTIFALGIVFSDARIYGLIEVVWLTGLPIQDPFYLTVLRWLVGIMAGAVLLAYVAQAARQVRQGYGLCWIKLLLLVTTAILYWVSGRLATNMLVGVAMFEVFHALQYDAIVWAYDRKLADRVGSGFGPLGFLFQDRWWCRVSYLVIIAAYGLLFYGFRTAGSANLARLAVVTYTTSAILHFYYDGFIWKVREKSTQLNLQIDTPSRFVAVSPWLHVGKWAVLGLTLAWLVQVEWRMPSRSDDDGMLDRLVRWTPNVPELQSRVSRAALRRGDVVSALAAAQRGVELRPYSHVARADLGSALLESGQFASAAKTLRHAIRLDNRRWQYHFDLAQALQQGEQWVESDQHYALAAELVPANAEIHRCWGSMSASRGQFPAAIRHLQTAHQLQPADVRSRGTLVAVLGRTGAHAEAISLAEAGVAMTPQTSAAHVCLGQSLITAGRFADASTVLARAVDLSPRSSEANYQLGLARVQTGDYRLAARSLDRALRFDESLAAAHFQRGNVFYLTGTLEEAVTAFHRCVELAPEYPGVSNNLGAVLSELGQPQAAMVAYRRALTLSKDDADAHFNLGLLLASQGDQAQARKHLARASELGHKIPATTREAPEM